MSYVDKEKERETRRRWYHKNKEKERARHRNRKRKEREHKRDEVNARARAYYEKNRDREARKQNERRIRREPHRGLRRAIQASENGAIDINQLAELIRKRIALSNELDDTAGRIRAGDGRVYSAGSEANSEEYLRHRANESKCG